MVRGAAGISNVAAWTADTENALGMGMIRLELQLADRKQLVFRKCPACITVSIKVT